MSARLKFSILRDAPGWPPGHIRLQILEPAKNLYTTLVIEAHWPWLVKLDAYRGLRKTHLEHSDK